MLETYLEYFFGLHIKVLFQFCHNLTIFECFEIFKVVTSRKLFKCVTVDVQKGRFAIYFERKSLFIHGTKLVKLQKYLILI